MPPQYIPPSGFDDQALNRRFKTVTVALLVGLGVLVTFLALTAERPRPGEPMPSQTLDQANVAEHRLTLTDGRVLTCLTFPGPGQPVSCDWSRASRGFN